MKPLLAALAALLILCGPVLAQDPGFKGLSGELRVAGSEVGLAAFRLAAEKIMAENPGVTVTFSLTGAGIGLTRLRMNQADICLYDRQEESAGKDGEPVRFVEYGVDPVAVVLSPVNQVRALTLDQAAGLFTGRIRDWSLVGGENVQVQPVYVDASEQPGKPDTRPGTISVTSQPAMRFTLMRNREAVSISSLRDLDASVMPLSVDGVAPSMEAFKAGRWKIYRTMRAALGPRPSPLATAFMEHMKGPEGQATLERAGYLPLSARPAFKSALPVDDPDLLVRRGG